MIIILQENELSGSMGGIHMSLRFEVRRTFQVPQEKAYASLLDLDAAKHWMQGRLFE